MGWINVPTDIKDQENDIDAKTKTEYDEIEDGDNDDAMNDKQTAR